VQKKLRRKTAAPPRAKITKDHPAALIADDNDLAAQEAIANALERADHPARATSRRSAVDRLGDPAPAGAEHTLVARVSNAIERELSKIEIIIGQRVSPWLRTEAESRARVLASLARTLKEIMRLREQEREAAGEKPKSDDDAIPRDLDALRSELARRLEVIVGEAKSLHPDETERG
jgi:hypothetical protein